jgi:phage terminase large subunit GpA-like protein
MDAASDPDIHTIVIMSSAQVGKTELLLNMIGYFAHQDPSPILLLQPTLEMAEAFSKDRLAPMVRDTRVLTERFAPAKSKGSGNTLLHKSFNGGHITMAGANSPSSLASRPIRVVLADEVDRYPISAGTEGDPVNLARKRTATFHNRKIILTSTPTVKGASRIEVAYEDGDRRHYHLQCPHCSQSHIPAWANVHWPEDNPHDAAYACPHCAAIWTERDRVRAIANGQWVASMPFHGVASFHLSELISPWSTPADMAVAFVSAKKGGAEMLKTWINTTLGETWEEDGQQADPDALIAFAENYDSGYIPESVRLLTAGIDTQDDRLECQIIGWSTGGTPWIIDHSIFWGDPAKPDCWRDLDNHLLQSYGGLKIVSAFIDSGGHHTEAVYKWAKQRHGRKIFACKGQGGQKEPVSKAKQVAAQRVMLVNVGIDPLKRTLLGWLKEPGQQIHFSRSLDPEWYAQLTAEKMVINKRKGFAVVEWQKTRDRNEALDCFVYGYAAMLALNVRWESMRQPEARPQPAPEPPPPEETPPPQAAILQQPRGQPSHARPRRPTSFIRRY